MNSEINKSRTYYEWIDVLKGVCCLFVLLNHNYPPALYKRFFTPFFLSMFFFASGYTFSTKENWRKFLLVKAKRLLVPFMLLGLFRIFVTYILQGGSLKKMLVSFFLQMNCRYDEMWFISCIFVTHILFRLLLTINDKIKNKAREIFVILTSVVISTLGYLDMLLWKVNLPWEMELAAFMLIFVCLGYFYRICEINFEKDKLSFYLFNSIVLVIYFVFAVFAPCDSDIHEERFQTPGLFIILMFLGGWGLIFVSKLLASTKIKKPLIFLGVNTIFFYAFGGFVRIILYPLAQKAGLDNPYFFSIINTLITPIILYYPCKFINRFLPWVVGNKRSR